MSLFFNLLKLNFIKRFQYRVHVFVSFAGECLSVFIRISLWMALFRTSPVTLATTFKDMMNYMALTGLVSLFNISNVGEKLGERIRDGSISTDLIKPYNLKSFILAQSSGENLAIRWFFYPYMVLSGFVH